ncbi:MAG: DUF1109 domain-containing protein [Burkholderiales bacterium]|nr:DUF1109 domain-containing protein [Burkholderiales bacterium]
MNTDDLVKMLATGAAPADARLPARRYAASVAAGLAASIVLMGVLLGANPELARFASRPMFWVKVAFPALVAAGALLAVARLSRPGAPLARVPAALAAPVVALWALAAVALVAAAPGERAALFFGATWTACPFNIAMLSVPAFVAVLWAMKGLAPTRLRLAGAGAGLLAGALGALVYTLHCPELAAPFLGVWYVLGILIPAAFGAVVGPRVLRW